MAKKSLLQLGVAAELVGALEERGISEPPPFLELVVPRVLAGRDIIAHARPDPAETLAFGAPLLQRVEPGRGVQALVVTPTEERCQEVVEDLTELGERIGVGVQGICGGASLDAQQRALDRGDAEVVVGAPGRLLDHVQRGGLDLDRVRVVVVDQAGELVELDSLPDAERIVEHCPRPRQVLVFSLAFGHEIHDFAQRQLTRPMFVRGEPDEPPLAPEAPQVFLLMRPLEKPRVLARILQSPGVESALVVARTRQQAGRLLEELRELDIDSALVDPDLGSARWERNLERFLSGQVDVLIASELATPGLDMQGVSHVVNYDCPRDVGAYLHHLEVADERPVALTFVTFLDRDLVKPLRRAAGAGTHPLHRVTPGSELLQELFAERDRAQRVPAARGIRRRGSVAAVGPAPIGSPDDETGAATAAPADEVVASEAVVTEPVEVEPAEVEPAEVELGEAEPAEPPEHSGTEPSETGAAETIGERTAAGPAGTPPGRSRTRIRGRPAVAHDLAGIGPKAAPVTSDEDDAAGRKAVTPTPGEDNAVGPKAPTPAPGDEDAAEPARRRGHRGRGGGRGTELPQGQTARDDGKVGSDDEREAPGTRVRSTGGRATSSAHSARDRDVEPAETGPPRQSSRPGIGARGEGRPMLARRVQVEHLP